MRRGARPRRKLIWARSFSPGVVIPSTSTAVQVPPVRFGLLDPFIAAYGADLIGCTIVRIRGRLWESVPGAAATAVRVGMKINDNRTPPDASENLYRPDDIGGAHDDWFGFHVLAGGPGTPDDMRYVDVDVRSARKLDELGQRLEMLASSFSDVDGDFVLAHDLSVLVMLS